MLNWIDTRSDAELAAAARDLFAAAFPDTPEPAGVWAVSYTHLTLPTICSV